MEEECKKAERILTHLGFDVAIPFYFQSSLSLYLVQRQYLDQIEMCDMVLVIPKRFVHNDLNPRHTITEDYSTMNFIVGESVSYEIAYARKIGKPVIFGMLPFVEEKEEKEDVSGNDEALCQGSLFWQSVEAKGV